MRLLAVSRGRDVFAAGQEQPVDGGQRLGDVDVRREDPDLAADVQHGLTVVLDLAAGGQADGGHKVTF